MKEYVWINEETGELHVSFMSAFDAIVYAGIDPQAFDRALEQSEPPMLQKVRYEYLGEL